MLKVRKVGKIESCHRETGFAGETEFTGKLA